MYFHSLKIYKKISSKFNYKINYKNDACNVINKVCWTKCIQRSIRALKDFVAVDMVDFNCMFSTVDVHLNMASMPAFLSKKVCFKVSSQK